MIITFVMSLFSSGSPIAIDWLVIAIIVAAFYGMFVGRAFTYISKKQGEITPSRTYYYSASAIVFITDSIRVIATVSHIKPNMIQRVFFQTVRSVALSSLFTSQASATSRMVANELVTGQLSDSTANTLAPPTRALVNAPCVAVNSQTREYLSRKIMESRVSWNWLKNNVIFIVGHFAKVTPFVNLIRLGMVLVAPFRAFFIIPQREVNI